MSFRRSDTTDEMPSRLSRGLLSVMIIALLFPHDLLALSQLPDSVPPPATIPLSEPLHQPAAVVEDRMSVDGDSVSFVPVDTIPVVTDSRAVAHTDTISPAGDDYTEVKKGVQPRSQKSGVAVGAIPGSRTDLQPPLLETAYCGRRFPWASDMPHHGTTACSTTTRVPTAT